VNRSEQDHTEHRAESSHTEIAERERAGLSRCAQRIRAVTQRAAAKPVRRPAHPHSLSTAPHSYTHSNTHSHTATHSSRVPAATRQPHPRCELRVPREARLVKGRPPDRIGLVELISHSTTQQQQHTATHTQQQQQHTAAHSNTQQHRATQSHRVPAATPTLRAPRAPRSTPRERASTRPHRAR
jgi:hypothetical protein